MLVEHEKEYKDLAISPIKVQIIYLFMNIVRVKTNTFIPRYGSIFHTVTKVFFQLDSNPGKGQPRQEEKIIPQDARSKYQEGRGIGSNPLCRRGSSVWVSGHVLSPRKIIGTRI